MAKLGELKRARQHQLRATKTTAARLGVQVRAVKERGIGPGDVKVLLADPPEWLTTEQQRRRVQIERETKDALRRELTDTLARAISATTTQPSTSHGGSQNVPSVQSGPPSSVEPTVRPSLARRAATKRGREPANQPGNNPRDGVPVGGSL